jgi:hypothetical protein
MIAFGPLLESFTGASIDLGVFALHPLVLMIIIGIALQGLAECFLSPKFLEYASKQAPKGEVGLYLGYQHLTTFIAWGVGFLAAGLLLNAFCPDPRKLEQQTRHDWRLATDPKYQFTLDDAQRADLGDGIQVPVSIARALADHGLILPERVWLVEAESKNGWRSDPERCWRIEEQLLTIEERWPNGKPWWAWWSSPETLSVTADGPRWPASLSEVERTFTLPGDLADCLADDEPIADGLRQALAEHGLDVPADASAREARPPDDEGPGEGWKIVVRQYSIEEAKLETDADAHSEGRERALRDVLLYANTPRSAEETPALPEDYKNARFVWFAFTGIGVVAFVALLVFKFVTNTIDRRRRL